MSMRASRSVARRQWWARMARRAALAVVVATAYFGRGNGWLALVGIGILGVLFLVIMLGEQQKCPRCEASLTQRHWWGDEYLPTCPQCGNPID
jgi:hypothetical protein